MKISELYSKVTESDSQHYDTLKKTGFWGKQGAGCILLASDTKKIGVTLRSRYVQSPGTLGTVGGAIDENDDPKTTTKKEVSEELGYTGPLQLIPLLVSERLTRTGDKFIYHNFLGIVPSEFEPKLNWENDDLLWMTLDELKEQSNLHTGLKMLLNDITSVNIIKRYINESNRDYSNINESKLTEGATDILFFYRRLKGTLGILNDNHFTLSSVTGNKAEEQLAPPGKPYFLSTTRSKVGDYHRYVGDSAAMFVLDGRWIGQRYSVKPVDYWYSGKTPDRLKKGEWKTLEPSSKRPMWSYSGSERTSESEDRIYSNKHTMPLTPIMSLHLYLNFDQLTKIKTTDEHISYRGKELHEIILRCQQLNIPVYVYNNVDDWKTQNKNKRLSIPFVLSMTEKLKKHTSDYVPRRYLDRVVELIVKDDKNSLSDDANKLRYNITNYSDEYKSIETDMHNSRKPGNADFDNVVLINSFMMKNKLKNVKELSEFLKQKWIKIKGEY